MSISADMSWRDIWTLVRSWLSRRRSDRPVYVPQDVTAEKSDYEKAMDALRGRES